MPKPQLMPGSLYPLYKRFLNPKEPTECHACHRPLDSGAATFLAVDEKPQPFGPKCARKFALEGSFRDLPDLMKDVMLVEDACAEAAEETKRTSVSKTAKELTSPRPRDLQNEIYKKAIIYILLRGRELPALGVRGVKWKVLTPILMEYEKGGKVINGVNLQKIITTMGRNAGPKGHRHLSLDNLLACYVFGAYLNKLYKIRHSMAKDDRQQLGPLNHGVKWMLYLNSEQCREVLALARKYLPNPPQEIRVQFVAPQPLKPKNKPPQKPSLSPGQ